MLTIKRSAIVAMLLLLPLFACFCGALASNGNVSPRPNPRPGQVTRLSWSRQAVPSGTPSLMVTNLSTNVSRLFATGRGGGGGTSRTAAKITGHKETHSQSAKTSLLQRYSHLIDTKPLATKAWTAGIVAALADLAAQTFIDPLTTHVSLRRALTFLFTGACFVGPYLHVWYAKLDATARYLRLSSPQARTLVKVLLNESIGVCIFFPLYFVAFEVAHGLTHGQGMCAQGKCRVFPYVFDSNTHRTILNHQHPYGPTLPTSADSTCGPWSS
jgi:hypothetical protein